jgi:hypothetical protein
VAADRHHDVARYAEVERIIRRTALDSAKNFDKDHPAMDRLGWPLDRFSFDNSVARYEPTHPTPWPN